MHSDGSSSVAQQYGFTLIEIMVAVAILAILAAIALPTYQESVRKSRRSEAFSAIGAVQQAQERWRGSHADYTLALSDLNVPATTGPGSYYTLSLAAPDVPTTQAAGYTVVATGASGTSQAEDGSCVRLRVRVFEGNVRQGAAAATGVFDESNASRCWAR
jgi:type IV pilus assembly protein PilE